MCYSKCSGVLQSAFAPYISCLGTLPLTNILSCKKMFLQSVNLKKDFFSAGQWPCAQQVARMGWFDIFHIPFRVKPRKRSDYSAKPCLSQDPPSSLAYLCWLIHERFNFSKVLVVVSAQNRMDVTSYTGAISETFRGFEKAMSQLLELQQWGRQTARFLPLLLVLVVPRS